jgi:hypothetical protein
VNLVAGLLAEIQRPLRFRGELELSFHIHLLVALLDQFVDLRRGCEGESEADCDSAAETLGAGPLCETQGSRRTAAQAQQARTSSGGP